MTKERRLAILMWEEIKTYIRDAKRPSDMDGLAVTKIKYDFMTKHHVQWRHGCWFCQYVRYLDEIHGEGCQRCPLSDGSADAILGHKSGCCRNTYSRVVNARLRKIKLKACDEIIATLKGETYGKRKSASDNGRSIRRNDTAN